MREKKFLYFIGFVSIASWLVHFFTYSNQYSDQEIMEGIIFIFLLTTIYFVLIRIYFSWNSGPKIVIRFLFITGLVLLGWITFIIESSA